MTYVCIGTCTRASTSSLDAEQIIQQHGHEVVMQELARVGVTYQEGEDWQARHLAAAQDNQVLILLPSRKGPSTKRKLRNMIK